jgi:hypothetical protein
MPLLRALILAVVVAALLPATGQGQGADARPLGFVTTPHSFELSDGEPISWFLEFSQPLKLTSDQKTTLINIRRRLRSENERHMERMDSIAKSVGLHIGERTRLDEDDRRALERFNEATQPTRDSIKVNNDLARAEVLTVLTAAQNKLLDSLMVELRRGRRDVRRRGPPGTD